MQITQITLINKVEDKKTYSIIGAAMEVQKELGCGFLEPLAKEFDSQNIPCRPQPIVKIFYKGSPLDKIYQPDFISI